MNRRQFLRTSAGATGAVIAIPLLSGFKGCTQDRQNTTAALVSVLGSSIQAIIAQQGNTAAAARLKVLTGAAVKDIQAWTPGTPSQDAVQALDDLAAFIGTLPISGNLQFYVDLAVSTVQGILAIVNPFAIAPRTTSIGTPITTAKQYKAAWNEHRKAHPNDGAPAL